MTHYDEYLDLIKSRGFTLGSLAKKARVNKRTIKRAFNNGFVPYWVLPHLLVQAGLYDGALTTAR